MPKIHYRKTFCKSLKAKIYWYFNETIIISMVVSIVYFSREVKHKTTHTKTNQVQTHISMRLNKIEMMLKY